MTKIANILTSIRVGLAGLYSSKAFIEIYLICGFTDLIDGPISRKTKSTSIRGTQLDTVGDILLYLALLKYMLRHGLLLLWFVLCFGSTLLIQGISAIIAKVKFGSFFFIHNFAAKLLGALLFIIYDTRVLGFSLGCY